MLRPFIDNLLPAFAAVGAGFLAARFVRADAGSLSPIAFYVMAPCLVFRVLTESDLPGAAFARMVALAALSLAIPALVAAWVGHRLGWGRPRIAALALVVLLPNAGNLGLPINRFAFGEAGLAQASVFFVTSSVLTFTVGVFVASLGRAAALDALKALPRVPTIWAVLAAVTLDATGLDLPLPAARTIGLLADGCIPLFLVILGVQLHGSGVRGPWGGLGVALLLRLGGGAAAALVLAPWLGLDGVARQAGVVQAAMPSAVICTVLAAQYDLEPAFVTSAVVLTTLACPLTLAPLLAFLGA